MAGDHADDAVNSSLDPYWDGEDEAWFRGHGFGAWSRRFRYRPLKYEQRTNQVVFSDFVDKPIDPSQF